MIRSERIEMIRGKRKVLMVERTNALVSIRNESGVWESHKDSLLPSETVLAGFFDGKNSPEIDQIRNAMLGWRFYHDFRTDHASPIRKPCLAVTTPSLSADGSDLAATLATLYSIRQDAAELQAAASVGQAVLQQAWQRALGRSDHATGQVLLAAGDFERRESYLNARHTLETLLAWGEVLQHPRIHHRVIKGEADLQRQQHQGEPGGLKTRRAQTTMADENCHQAHGTAQQRETQVAQQAAHGCTQTI